MSDILGTLAVTTILALPLPVAHQAPGEGNWCRPGTIVMVPDGREAFVSSTDGDICRVIAEGEGYVTPIPFFIVEPVYPQIASYRPVGH